MTGEVLTPAQRVEIISCVTGKDIKYIIIPITVKYDKILEAVHSHLIAVDMVDNMVTYNDDKVTPVIKVFLRRKPQTFEEYLTANREKLH